MTNEENIELEKIEEELKQLGDQETIAPFIVGSVFGVVFIVVGVILIALGAITWIGNGLFIGGGVVVGFGLIISIGMVFKVGKISETNTKIQELNQRKHELSHNKTTAEETDEDTLLRLLSEGKITVEEYKKLSKK